MKFNKIVLLNIFLLFTYSTLIAGKKINNTTLTGKWINEKEGIGLEIYQMHENLYGKIVWLQHPYDNHGNLKTDKKNPNQALRNRPLIGINIIENLIYKSEKKWENGKFYAVRKGKYAKCEIEQINSDRIKMTVKIIFIKKHVTWKRVKQFSVEK